MVDVKVISYQLTIAAAVTAVLTIATLATITAAMNPVITIATIVTVMTGIVTMASQLLMQLL